MGYDWLLGKPATSQLPSWLQNFYTNPPPGYMDYLKTGMLPPTSSSSTTNSSSRTASSGSSSFANAPFITGDYAPVATLQRDLIFNRLAGGGLPEGYMQEGLRNIGQATSAASSGLRDSLISRGLGGRTASGSDSLASTSASLGASFLNTLPQLARENQSQDLGMAQAMIGQFGTGQMGTSRYANQSATTGTSTTDSVQSGGLDVNGIGGLLASIMPYYTAPRQGGLFGQGGLLGGGLFGQLLGMYLGSKIGGSGGGGGTTYLPGTPGYGG